MLYEIDPFTMLSGCTMTDGSMPGGNNDALVEEGSSRLSNTGNLQDACRILVHRAFSAA